MEHEFESHMSTSDASSILLFDDDDVQSSDLCDEISVDAEYSLMYASQYAIHRMAASGGDDVPPQYEDDADSETINETADDWWRRKWDEREKEFEKEVGDIITSYEERLLEQSSYFEGTLARIQQQHAAEIDDLNERVRCDAVTRARLLDFLLAEGALALRRRMATKLDVVAANSQTIIDDDPAPFFSQNIV